jgi:DNA end-binding protein Ku
VSDPQELSLLRPESDKSVEADGFIPPTAIDPIYYSGKSYYLLPDGVAGNKPYALLHKGMVDADVYGIAHAISKSRT